MGAVMAPATESIMSVVPREKAGAGAAVNNSVRQVGGALGVAILGSVLAASYSAHLGGAVDALPAAARAEASQSIVATLEAVRQAEAGDDADAARAAAELVEPARRPSSRPCTSPRSVTAAAALVAAAIVLVWLPGRRESGGVRHASDPMVQRTVDGDPSSGSKLIMSSRGSPRREKGVPVPDRSAVPASGRRDPFAPLLENPLAALFRQHARAGAATHAVPTAGAPAAGHPLRRRPAPDQPGQQQLPRPGQRPPGDRGRARPPSGSSAPAPPAAGSSTAPRACTSRSRRSSPTTTAPRPRS